MKTVTPTELRANIYKLLEEVLDTGTPLEVKKGGRRLRIVPVERGNKLRNLRPRPDVIQGDPDDLASIHWEGEINLDLP
jgi:antitoxin (DNA-binding transcriptional repressor) of toxin-antitoxin stability system